MCVGTDDADVAAHLQPWHIDEPAGLVDFGLTMHPPVRPRGVPRELPSLRHGTEVMARAHDTAALCDGLLRTLAGLGPAPADTIRLTGVPLLRDGAVDLAPPALAAALPSRWLAAHGYTPVYTQSVTIHPATMAVHIPAPLGSDAAPIVAPLGRWWVTLNDPTASLTFAELMVRTAPRLDLAVPATAALTGLMSLMQQLPPLPVSAARGDLQAALFGAPSTFGACTP